MRKRAKTSKEFVLVEALDRVVDILGMAIGKGRAIKQMGQSGEDEELKDYVARVINKVDQLTANI